MARPTTAPTTLPPTPTTAGQRVGVPRRPPARPAILEEAVGEAAFFASFASAWDTSVSPRAARALLTDSCSAAIRSTSCPGRDVGAGTSGGWRPSCLASITVCRGLGVVVGELRAGEVVAGHGLDQRHGFVDFVFVQLDRRRDHGGGVTSVVRSQQTVQSDRISPYPQQTKPLTAVPREPRDRDPRGALQGVPPGRPRTGHHRLAEAAWTRMGR